jgi:hypothetical protein
VGITVGDTSGGGNSFHDIHLPVADGVDCVINSDDDCISPLTIAGNTITDSDCAMFAGFGGASTSVDVENNLVTRMSGFGMYFGGNEAITFSGNQVTGVLGTTTPPLISCTDNAAVCLSGVRVQSGRNNTIVGNPVGIEIVGTGMGVTRDTIDFGSASSPGNNVFSCNSSTGGSFGWDVHIHLGYPSDPGLPILLAGNSWDHDSPFMGPGNGGDVFVADTPSPSPSIDVSNPKPAQFGNCPGTHMH